MTYDGACQENKNYPLYATEAEANAVNTRIAATMYYAAMTESVALAEAHGAYDTFAGSPLSRGLFSRAAKAVASVKAAGGVGTRNGAGSRSSTGRISSIRQEP